jgi:hypothetical protein
MLRKIILVRHRGPTTAHDTGTKAPRSWGIVSLESIVKSLVSIFASIHLVADKVATRRLSNVKKAFRGGASVVRMPVRSDLSM